MRSRQLDMPKLIIISWKVHIPEWDKLFNICISFLSKVSTLQIWSLSQFIFLYIFIFEKEIPGEIQRSLSRPRFRNSVAVSQLYRSAPMNKLILMLLLALMLINRRSVG